MATSAIGDLAVLSTDELEDELATLASHLYAGTCRWLELVGEIDRRGEWAESGRASCAEWLAWRCALTPRAAREHVRVARRLAELPLIHEAFSRGELSYAKVRALTRVATAENEEELLELASVMTAAQLERSVRAYRRVTTAEACEQQEEAYLSVFWEADGSLEIHGRLAPEDGALLLRALDAVRDAEWNERRGSAEPRPARQASNAEALVAVAEAALANPDRRAARAASATKSSCTPTRPCSPTTARAAASSTTEARCLLRPRAGLLATPPSCRTAARRGRSRLRSGARCARATAAAAFRAARTAASSTPTTSTTGRKAARRRPTTSCCSAAATTGSCTRAAGTSTAGCASTIAGGSRFPAVPRLPRGHPGELVSRNGDLDIDAESCEPGTGEELDLAAAVEALLAIAA